MCLLHFFQSLSGWSLQGGRDWLGVPGVSFPPRGRRAQVSRVAGAHGALPARGLGSKQTHAPQQEGGASSARVEAAARGPSSGLQIKGVTFHCFRRKEMGEKGKTNQRRKAKGKSLSCGGYTVGTVESKEAVQHVIYVSEAFLLDCLEINKVTFTL